jgi:HK97 family phage major capsid protein
MPTGTATVPELTAEQVQRILVQPLEDRSVFLNAGPRIFDTPGSPVRVPKLVGMTIAPTWIGENQAIPDTTEMNTDEVVLMPETMKSIKIISRFSNELARQSIIGFDAALRDRLVTDVSNVLDNALLSSTVTNGTQPLGLLNYVGTQQMTAVGVPSLDDLHDAIGMMFAANVDTTRVRWFMTSREFVGFRKLKDNGGRYQLQPDPTQAGGYTLLGIPVRVSNRIPQNGGLNTDASSIVLADFSTIAVARDLAPSVTVLSERYADFDQIGVRIVTRYDAAPLLPEAILVMRGVTA